MNICIPIAISLIIFPSLAGFNTSGNQNISNLSDMLNGTQDVSLGHSVTTNNNLTTVKFKTVPIGSIFMFKGNCPSGTRHLSGMEGRAPVGSGNLNDGTLNHSYKLNATGGTQRHKTSVAEMPQHRHRYLMDDNTLNYSDNIKVRQLDGRRGSDGGGSLWEYQSAREGGNQFHENRMPYRVFNFCEVI